MSETEFKVRTPLFPSYSAVSHILRVWNGEPKAAVMSMMKAISDQMGTPQKTLDWTDPDTWIRERLSGEDAHLATKIWTQSGKKFNPRYSRGSYFFVKNFHLLEPDSTGIFRLTARGQQFLDGNFQIIREIDDAEGILDLIQILATKGEAKRSELIPDWSEFLKSHSKYGTTTTIKDTLRRRLVNLIDRGLARKKGNTYSLTEAGREYEKQVPDRGGTPQTDVLRSIETFNKKQREVLRERLLVMDPVKFEHLISDLLDAMGYEDVTVTQASGDLGIDVVGTVQVGITEIKEVVQVKRKKSTIGRPTMDQLRGALHYHHAIRGTIITLGRFSSGCQTAAMFPGAPPITLIDGERLLDMLIENQIGIRKKPVDLYEIDDSYFDRTVPPELEEPSLTSIEIE